MCTLDHLHKSAAKALCASHHALLDGGSPEAQVVTSLGATAEIALYTITALIADPALADYRAALLGELLAHPDNAGAPTNQVDQGQTIPPAP